MKFEGTILFRCDATPQLGLGHLSRCAAIAGSLARGRCQFAVRGGELAERYLRERLLPFEIIDGVHSGAAEGSALAAMAERIGAEVVVLDVRDNDLEVLRTLKESGLVVVDFEDRGPGRREADLLIDSHLQPGTEEATCGGSTRCGFGPAWAVLHQRYTGLHGRIAAPVPETQPGDKPLAVAVALGGTDPAGLTARVFKILERHREPLLIDVVVGPGASLEKISSARHELHVRKAPHSLAPILCRSGLAIVSGGITMFESLCLARPTVVVPQHEEQFRNAARLASRGALLLTPPPADPSFAIALEVVLNEMLQDEELRAGLSCRAWSTVDGRGLERLKLALASLTAGNLTAAR